MRQTNTGTGTTERGRSLRNQGAGQGNAEEDRTRYRQSSFNDTEGALIMAWKRMLAIVILAALVAGCANKGLLVKPDRAAPIRGTSKETFPLASGVYWRYLSRILPDDEDEFVSSYWSIETYRLVNVEDYDYYKQLLGMTERSLREEARRGLPTGARIGVSSIDELDRDRLISLILYFRSAAASEIQAFVRAKHLYPGHSPHVVSKVAAVYIKHGGAIYTDNILRDTLKRGERVALPMEPAQLQALLRHVPRTFLVGDVWTRRGPPYADGKIVLEKAVVRKEKIREGNTVFESFAIAPRVYRYSAERDVLHRTSDNPFVEEWYAPGVGLVRSSKNLGGAREELDIIEFFDPRTALHWRRLLPKSAREEIYKSAWFSNGKWRFGYERDKEFWLSLGLTPPVYWEE